MSELQREASYHVPNLDGLQQYAERCFDTESNCILSPTQLVSLINLARQAPAPVSAMFEVVGSFVFQDDGK